MTYQVTVEDVEIPHVGGQLIVVPQMHASVEVIEDDGYIYGSVHPVVKWSLPSFTREENVAIVDWLKRNEKYFDDMVFKVLETKILVK